MDQVAGLHVVAIAHQGFAVGQKGEAIPAGEHAQRAQGLEARGKPGHAMPAGDEVVLECLTGALGELMEMIAGIAKLAQAGQAQTVGEAVEVKGDLASVGHAEFAGFSWG